MLQQECIQISDTEIVSSSMHKKSGTVYNPVRLPEFCLSRDDLCHVGEVVVWVVVVLTGPAKYPHGSRSCSYSTCVSSRPSSSP